MEKNDHNLIDNKIPKGMGIIEQIRALQGQEPTKKDVEEALRTPSPYPRPNTNKIYCGTELADKLQALLNL